ncbi:MAG: SDR family oxidoreductase [Candidatus Adlerbacteria bacterium]
MQKVLLVTGSSRGIGAATASAAAHRRYDVCINYRNPLNAGRAQLVLDDIQKLGVRAIAVRADIADARQVEDLFKTIDRELGPVTALVNNAGISGDRKAFLDQGEVAFARVLAVNLMGTINCTREALKRMAKSLGGAIVSVSSSAAVSGGKHLTAYVTAANGIEGFTRSVAKDYAQKGIRANIVRAGVIATEQQPLGDERWVERMELSIPLRRLGKDSEVAEAIMFLLSPASSYMTGSVVDVNGGRF